MLNPVFERKLGEALQKTMNEGFRLEIYRKYTTPKEQARLWAKSRTDAEIMNASRAITAEGANYLGGLLLDQIPLQGRKETDLLPGQSWHQFGEAADVVLTGPDGVCIWAPGHFGYEVFARNAEAAGLVAGYYWRRRDSNHVQLRQQTVRSLRSWVEIDQLAERMDRQGPTQETVFLVS